MKQAGVALSNLCQPKTPPRLFGGLRALRSTPVVVVQPVEDGNRDEPSSPRPGWLGPGPSWNPLPNPLVWPCSVEVFDVFLDDPMKVPVPDK